MAEMITLSGNDGFAFAACHAPAVGTRKGGVIVIQEIFGIDRHVRADVERWSALGYEAIAPSLYDRREPGFTAEHDPEGLQAGVAHARATPLDQALGDITACRDFLKAQGNKVCVVGYCYGGSLTWLSAGKVDGISAASSYYGSMVAANAGLAPAVRPSSTWAAPTPASRPTKSRRRSMPTMRMCQSISTKTPATVSTTRARNVTMPPRRRWLANAHLSSSTGLEDG